MTQETQGKLYCEVCSSTVTEPTLREHWLAKHSAHANSMANTNEKLRQAEWTKVQQEKVIRYHGLRYDKWEGWQWVHEMGYSDPDRNNKRFDSISGGFGAMRDVSSRKARERENPDLEPRLLDDGTISEAGGEDSSED